MTVAVTPAVLLAGKTAIVTGAAMGIGKAIAQVFVREGARVLAADIDDAIHRTAAEIGPDCLPVHADVSREEDVKAMFEKARQVFGKIDVVVNNAGTIVTPEPELSLANYEAMTQTNFLGVVHCTRAAVEAMVPAGGGSIINISSVGSLNAEDRAGIIYSAAKAAVNSLTKSIAVRYGGQGVRANVLAPGFTLIEKTQGARPETIAPMAQKSPMQRAAQAREQAEVAAFLASDRASFVNGVVLPVDGGWAARMA